MTEVVQPVADLFHQLDLDLTRARPREEGVLAALSSGTLAPDQVSLVVRHYFPIACALPRLMAGLCFGAEDEGVRLAAARALVAELGGDGLGSPVDAFRGLLAAAGVAVPVSTRVRPPASARLLATLDELVVDDDPCAGLGAVYALVVCRSTAAAAFAAGVRGGNHGDGSPGANFFALARASGEEVRRWVPPLVDRTMGSDRRRGQFRRGVVTVAQALDEFWAATGEEAAREAGSLGTDRSPA